MQQNQKRVNLRGQQQNSTNLEMYCFDIIKWNLFFSKKQEIIRMYHDTEKAKRWKKKIAYFFEIKL